VVTVATWMVWMMVGAPSAFADEFAVVVVVGHEAGDTSTATFMDGFRLAVDESPDVSHPAGVEGGDHLGSMDVVITVVDGVSGSEEIVSAVTDSVALEGAAIVVADLSPPDLEAMIGPLAESETMLIAVSDTGSGEFGPTRFFYPVNDLGNGELLLDLGGPTFEAAFVDAYGVEPTAVAKRGYLAGRLVDVAVGATNRDPGDEQSLAAGLAAVTGSSPDLPDVTTDVGVAASSPDVTTDVGVAASSPDVTTDVGVAASSPDVTTSDSDGERNSGSNPWPVAIAALVVAAIIGMAAYAMSRRR